MIIIELVVVILHDTLMIIGVIIVSIDLDLSLGLILYITMSEIEW